MSENEGPDWFAELAKGGEALRRQIEPLVQAAEQFVRDSRRAKTNGGPALPLAQRVALAVDAGIRELRPERKRPVAYQRTAGLVVNVSFVASAKMTAGAGLVVEPVFGAVSKNVAAATEIASMEVLDSRRGLAALSDGQIVVLVLVWLFAFVLPMTGSALSPELHVALSDSYATFAIALAITWRIRDRNK
jgi:hypothetical protein